MLRCVVILAVLAAMSVQAAPSSASPTTFTLDNGLRVVLVEDHSVPRVHLAISVHTGSAFESPGRTGFAHLFEHLMFEGSAHVPEGKFDEWLEAAGGSNNAWTSEDTTFYFEEAPSNALELLLFLESDRFGFFLDGLNDGTVDGQRDIVKNERRQSYENRPYGAAQLAVPSLLWPQGHPYSWPVIGSMDDLTAANLDDVKGFFRRFYGPENAILVLVGDFTTAQARPLVTAWFSEVPRRGPAPAAPTQAPVRLSGERRAVYEDNVELPRVSLVWPSAALMAADDAPLDVLSMVLAGGASSRLQKRLVRDEHLAQSVSAQQESRERAGVFTIDVLARPNISLPAIVRIVDEEIEKLRRDGPTTDELQRARAMIEATHVRSLDSLAGLAARTALWMSVLGHPNGLEADIGRYRNVTAAAVQTALQHTVVPGRVVVSVVPRGRLDLAVINRVAASGAR